MSNKSHDAAHERNENNIISVNNNSPNNNYKLNLARVVLNTKIHPEIEKQWRVGFDYKTNGRDFNNKKLEKNSHANHSKYSKLVRLE